MNHLAFFAMLEAVLEALLFSLAGGKKAAAWPRRISRFEGLARLGLGFSHRGLGGAHGLTRFAYSRQLLQSVV